MFNFDETKDIRTVFFIFSNTMTVKKEITKKKKPKQKQKQKQKQTVVVNGGTSKKPNFYRVF